MTAKGHGMPCPYFIRDFGRERVYALENRLRNLGSEGVVTPNATGPNTGK